MAKSLHIREVARDAPIRLSTAAALAFPDGTMTALAFAEKHFEAGS